MTTEDRIRTALQYLGYSEDRILEILAAIAEQDASGTSESTTPTSTPAPAAPAIVDDIFTADAAHAVNDVFGYTGETATGNDTINNFDNLSGDGSSSDRLDLSAVFDALGGKYTDGVNDFADRKAALHLTVGDFDGDGATDDARLTVDGLKDFSLTFLNPTGGGVGSFHIASEAGGPYADIVIGGGASTPTPSTPTPSASQPDPKPTPTASDPQPQTTPTPSTPVPDSSPPTPSSTSGLFEDKFPAHYARLSNGINIERSQFSTVSDQELKLLHDMGVQHIRIFMKTDEFASSGNVDPATNSVVQSTLNFAHRAIDAGLAVIVTPLGDVGVQNNISSMKTWLGQISGYIADHFDPQDLFIEIYNEPFMSSGEAAWWDYASQLATTVRQAAPDFTIIVPGNGYDAGKWSYIGALTKSAALPLDNVVYSVHYYDPFNFTHQGASWIPEFANVSGVHYPGAWGYDASTIDADFAKLQAWAEQNGVYATVNEFGAIKYAPEAERAQWLTDVRVAAEKHNLGWAIWDLDKAFSITQEINGVQTIKDAFQKALTLGAYQDGSVDWQSLAQDTSTQTPVVTDPTNDPQHNNTDSSTSTSTSQPTTTPTSQPNHDWIVADQGFNTEEKFVFTAADLNQTVTIVNYDPLSNPNMINDQIDLSAIFTALGGKFTDGVNDLADRQAAIHFIQTDLDNSGWQDDSIIKIDGAPNFEIQLIHPAAANLGSFQFGDGSGVYDDILIA